jgi:hypothetical protein
VASDRLPIHAFKRWLNRTTTEPPRIVVAETRTPPSGLVVVWYR